METGDRLATGDRMAIGDGMSTGAFADLDAASRGQLGRTGFLLDTKVPSERIRPAFV
jgi:hypothetical protein